MSPKVAVPKSMRLRQLTGMVDIADERPRLGDADPVVPVESGGHRVGALRQGIGIAPLLFAPGVHFFDLADGAALHQLDGGLVFAAGVNLNAHLGDQLLLARECGEHADLVDAVRQGFLLVDREPAVHGGHRHGRVHVVGRADADGVDIAVLFGEHLAPVLVDAGVGRTHLELVELGGIDLGDADQFDLGMAQQDVEGDEGHAARAEGAEAELVAGRSGNQVPDEERGSQEGAAVE